MTEPVAVLTRFSRSLRDEGLAVGTGRVVRFCRAAALLEPCDLYWAGRATLVSRPQDAAVYDRVFAAFFGSSPEGKAESAVRVRVTGDLEPEFELALASPLELLRRFQLTLEERTCACNRSSAATRFEGCDRL